MFRLNKLSLIFLAIVFFVFFAFNYFLVSVPHQGYHVIYYCKDVKMVDENRQIYTTDREMEYFCSGDFPEKEIKELCQKDNCEILRWEPSYTTGASFIEKVYKTSGIAIAYTLVVMILMFIVRFVKLGVKKLTRS